MPGFGGLSILQQRTARAHAHLARRGLATMARHPELLLAMTEFAESEAEGRRLEAGGNSTETTKQNTP